MADWVTPKTDWTPADGIGSADMNRIESNIKFLYETPKHGKKKITSSQSWTVPPWVTTVWVMITGASGGDGSDYNSSHGYFRGGSGGSGAGVWCKEIAVTPGEVIPVTIGVNGTDGGTNKNGTDGGASKFGNYVTVGGGKGGTAARPLAVDPYGEDGVDGADGGPREVGSMGSGLCLIEW